MSFKHCPKCHEDKTLSEYYPAPSSRSKDKLQSWCKSCSRKASNKSVKNRSARIRQFLNDYKVSKGCTDCGYNQHAQALDFDHLKDKKFGLSYSMTRPIDDILNEISKCEIVCANCHRVRTHNRLRSNVIQKSSK